MMVGLCSGDAVAPSTKLIVFDCDSTLSAIEGVDELGRAGGPALFAQVEAMTHAAMDGKITVESVFGRRLAVIRPTRAQVEAVARLYLERIEPTAQDTIKKLQAAGWTAVILSGGFRQAILPLAERLGIAQVEAVDLFFDEQGNYTGFDESYPTTRSGGKPLVIATLKRQYQPARIVMVGDGVSDLEAKPVVDLFVGFGGYVARPKVREGATIFITRLAELLPHLL